MTERRPPCRARRTTVTPEAVTIKRTKTMTTSRILALHQDRKKHLFWPNSVIRHGQPQVCPQHTQFAVKFLRRFIVSHCESPSQKTRRTRHPLCRLCPRGQERGHPPVHKAPYPRLTLAEGSADPQGLLRQTHASRETLKLRVENNAIKVRIHFYPN
jgi:hypothetical protein